MPGSHAPDFIAICDHGQVPLGSEEFSAAGFSVAVSPAMYVADGVDRGKMNCLPELYRYVSRGETTTQFEDNLRSAYAKMLHDYADAPSNVVFGEADACPSMPVTRVWLDKLLSSPAASLYDVLILGLDKSYPPCVSLPALDGSCFVEVGQLYRMIMGCAYPKCQGNYWLMYGTQAVWVRPEARPVLEDCIRHIVAPTDTLMFHVGMSGILRVGKCTSNLFYQKFHRHAHK